MVAHFENSNENIGLHKRLKMSQKAEQLSDIEEELLPIE
jgi:hypothetical protein